MLLADCTAALSAWSTFGTFLVALIALLFALCQIRISNSVRTTELIVKTYNAFVDSEKMSRFYARIRRGDQFDWEADDRFLNKSLTLFDSLGFLQTQGLLHSRAKAWEYIASEIQYFASNPSVCAYIEARIEEARSMGFHDEILPFTGFPALLANIPERYHAGNFPCIPENHKILRALVNTELALSRSLRSQVAQLRYWLVYGS